MCDLVLCCGGLTYPLTMHQGRFQKRSEVRCGAVGWQRKGGPRSRQVHVRSIKPCSPSATRVATNQPNGAEWRAATQRQRQTRGIDRPQGRPFIVCHDKQQAASSAGASPSPRPRRSRGRGRSKSWPGINHRGMGGDMDRDVRARELTTGMMYGSPPNQLSSFVYHFV